MPVKLPLKEPSAEVADAGLDWLLNAAIASVPLGGHWLVRTFGDGVESAHRGVPAWTADVLVLSITLAGISGVNAFTKLDRCGVVVKTGRSTILFRFLAIVVLLYSGFLYGLVMGQRAAPIVTMGAVWGLWASVVVSIYLDMALAGRIASAKKQEGARASA